MNREKVEKAVLPAVFIVAAFLLTALALYKAPDIGQSGLLNYQSWSAPLVYLVIVLIFMSDRIRSLPHVLVALGIFALCAFMIIVPLPEQVAGAVKWWYPLGVGLAIHLFADL